jgi:hypothetical protein
LQQNKDSPTRVCAKASLHKACLIPAAKQVSSEEIPKNAAESFLQDAHARVCAEASMHKTLLIAAAPQGVLMQDGAHKHFCTDLISLSTRNSSLQQHHKDFSHKSSLLRKNPCLLRLGEGAGPRVPDPSLSSHGELGGPTGATGASRASPCWE